MSLARNLANLVKGIFVDSSNNVGIGTSSPGAPLSFADTNALKIQFNGNAANYYGMSKLAGSGSLGDGEFRFTSGNTAGGSFTFSNGGTEKVRIDSSGNLLVGTTSGSGRVNAATNLSDIAATNAISRMSFVASGGYGGGVSVIDGSQGYGLWAQASGADFYIRRSTTSGSFTGGVYISNAAGSWSSASDERLKNILRPIENATDKLMTLRCIVGEYKDQVGVEHPFLIAQDVQAVFPEVVNTFGDEDHLGMSYTDMVPILVKAIQEQQAIINQLRSDVDALKAA